MIELVARRASRSGFEVVVATSEEEYDERIAHHLEARGVSVVRGPLDDVLGRFAMATADMADNDRVVRLTGDNPLADADLVQELMDRMAESGHQYGRVDIDVVPEGLGVEVFSVELLRAAHEMATQSYDREHVTPWIRRNTTELLFAPRKNPGEPAVHRATVDCLQDYFRISRLFDDVRDPVAIPWFELMDKLMRNVASLGATARHVSGSEEHLTSVVLGASRVGEYGSGSARAVFSHAVDCGISDVLCEVAEGPILTTGMLPGLKQRMGIILLLPGLGSSRCAVNHLETLIERILRESGSARLRAVLVRSDDLSTEASGATEPVGTELLRSLRDHVSRGVVEETGIFLVPGNPMAPEEIVDVDFVVSEVRAREDLSEFVPWHQRGITTLAMLRSDDHQLLLDASASNVVDAVAVYPRDRKELATQLALVSASPAPHR